MFGVGTTMKVEDYDILAKKMAETRSDTVVMFIDHEPGNPLKVSAEKYAHLVTAIAKQVRTLIPICKNTPELPQFLIGGHSASGGAAIESLVYMHDLKPIGIFGLSPFRITDKTRINDLPSLFWGFSRTTCGVTIGNAADKAYELSNPDNGRALYQLQNGDGHPSHCIFADNGCLPICPSPKAGGDYAWVRSAVALSLDAFLRSIETDTFTRESFKLPLPDHGMKDNLKMFVYDENVTTANNQQSLRVRSTEQLNILG
jgi:hypothetical protein